MKAWFVAAAAVLSLALAGCEEVSDGGIDAERVANAASDSANWITYGRDYSEQRYSPLDEVSTETVGELGLAWFADLDTARGQEGTPLVINGTIYITTAWSKVKAYDAAIPRLTTSQQAVGATSPGTSGSYCHFGSPVAAS